MAKKSGRPAAKRKPSRAVKKTPTKKKPVASPAAVSVRPRRIKLPKYKSLRLQRNVKHPVKLPNVWRLSRTASLTIWRQKRLFVGITLVYGLLNLVLVQGLSSNTDVSSLKHELGQIFTGNWGSLASSLSILVILIGSSGSGSSQTAGPYQLFLGLIASLAIIWTLRQVLAGSANAKPRIRDAYYNGIYPLVPFILVLLVIGLELLPLIVGATLYATVTTNGIAVSLIEKLLWTLLFGSLVLATLYMLSSSLFALYIVTLPNMTPLKALRSARGLVRYRRWPVLRKILCLPLILLLVAAVIMLPIIAWLALLAPWIFFLLTMFALLAVHTYMYTLYRELINE